MGQTLKLVVGASAGGHANELLVLLHAARGIWTTRPMAYVTTMQITAASFASLGAPVHLIGECNRHMPFRTLMVIGRSMALAWRLKPDVVVTTGALPLAIFCLWAKTFGAKIVWIDSIAQIDHLSLSGRLMRYFADLCLSQWPDVAAQTKGVEYAGEVM